MFGDRRIILLSGKATGNLQVEDAAYVGERLPTTSVERTLVDIAVRPIYAGGVEEVLLAYENARDIVSVPLLADILSNLKHVYPYKQAIGFYLERAGYPESSLKIFMRNPFDFDFFLVNQIEKRAYSKKWRLFYPEGL